MISSFFVDVWEIFVQMKKKKKDISKKINPKRPRRLQLANE
jgi:hypothetical protein